MANKNGGFIGTDGLDAPDAPTAVTPTAGNEQVSVAFTAPATVVGVILDTLIRFITVIYLFLYYPNTIAIAMANPLVAALPAA